MSTVICPTCNATLRTRGRRFLLSVGAALVVGVAIGILATGVWRP